MKIFCVSMFAITLLVSLYILYANEINRKLNIKKRQMAVTPGINKYRISLCVCSVLLFVFGGLLVYQSLNHDYSVIKRFNSIIEYQRLLEKDDLDYVSLSKNGLEYQNELHTTYDEDYVYFVSNNELTELNTETKSIRKKVVLTDEGVHEFKVFAYKNFIFCIAIENDLFHMYSYDRSTMNLLSRVDVDGSIKNVFVHNEYLHFILQNDAIDDPTLLGVNSNIKAKEFVENVYYLDCLSFDKIITHICFNLEKREFKQISLCVSDYFLLYMDKYVYIFCNAYKNEEWVNSSFILKYDLDKMECIKYKEIDEVIFCSPIVKNDSIYLIINDIDRNKFFIDRYDYGLNKKEYHEIKINNTELINNLNNDIDKLLIYNNQLIKIQNIFYYNNDKVYNYKANGNEKEIKIYFYDIFYNRKNEWLIRTDKVFNTFDIKETICDDEYTYLVYSIDGVEGYLKISNVIKDEVKEIVIKDNGKYYFDDDHVVILETNNIDVLDK